METFLEEFKYLKLPLEDIKLATDNFNVNKKIGDGGFGMVYKGELSHFKGRSMVAIKRLDRKFGQGKREFWKEIMTLSRYPHENLISLLGFCEEGGEEILVYEHAFNGSLDRHLSSTTFTWTQRLKICLDAARGLRYLHEDKGTLQRVLHRDIKSSNILLDDKWHAKVSDMGLSKIGPANQQHTALVTNVVGTRGYLDPMYMELGILTKESDVYSFGVVLFEVLFGRLCFENSNGRFLSLVRMWKQKYKQKKLEEIIFQELMQEMDLGSLETYSDIAFQCLQKYCQERPAMSLVVEKLETALEFQEIYEGMKRPVVAYEKIIKTAVHPLTYNSYEELKSCLSKGILLNSGKTWFSLNKNGEHCEMISATECIIRTAETSFYDGHISENNSRFPPYNCYVTHKGIFKAHVRTQFLSPQITYTVNLVFKVPGEVLASDEPRYLGIQYSLEGETGYSISFLADAREDGWLMAELYQFESKRRNVELEILFEGNLDNSCYYSIEGIEFRPIEKVEHEALEDANVDMQTISESDVTYWETNLPNDYDDIIKLSKDGVKWTTKKELYYILCKGFLISNGQLVSNGQLWFSLAKNGKRCLMLPARSALSKKQWSWKYHTESRFGKVAFDPIPSFSIVCKIKSRILSPETTYASYLVYKLPDDIREILPQFEFLLKVKDTKFHDKNYSLVFTSFQFIFLINPQIPVIRPKADQNSHNPLNRPKLKAIPQQRNDGWMEVQVWKFRTSTTNIEIKMQVNLDLCYLQSLQQLTVLGIEFRPE